MKVSFGFPVVVSHGAVGHLVTIFDSRWESTRTRLKFKSDRLWILFTVPNKYGEEYVCAVNSSHMHSLEDIQSLRRTIRNVGIVNPNTPIFADRPKRAKRLKTTFTKSVNLMIPSNRICGRLHDEVVILATSVLPVAYTSGNQSLVEDALLAWTKIESKQLNQSVASQTIVGNPPTIEEFCFREPLLSDTFPFTISDMAVVCAAEAS